MENTFNEKAYRFYEDGLELLKEIKANTDKTLEKQDEIILLQEDAIKRIKMANIHLDTMTELRLDENDID